MSLSVLVAVTHLLGVGHLARAAAIARALARRGHRVTLASGGMPAPLISREGVELVQLPPVRTAPGDFRTLLDARLRPIGPATLDARRRMLREIVARARPDVLVTELFPFGRRVLADEFLDLVAAARAQRPNAAIVASVRDILVAPAKVARIAETHARLARLYDAVLVHGDPDLVPLEASWPLDEATRKLLHYTGYVDAEAKTSPPAGSQPQADIVVSGGGGAAGLPLLRAALEASRACPNRRWLILAGGGIDNASFAALRSGAPAHAAVERARPDFRVLLTQAELSVSQAGYNTVNDVLASGVRAVLVPFEEGRETEQRPRADRLGSQERVVVLPESELDAAALTDAVTTALAMPRPVPQAGALDGARRSAEIIEGLAASSQRLRRPAIGAPRESAWVRLDDALAGAAKDGVTIPLWWRDDDAVAHTPALDRLIALSCAARWPLAVAAIPAFAENSLAGRIADEPSVSIVVHGWSHQNHAPPGAKKSEFGADRPEDAARTDACRSATEVRKVFGQRFCPVFVPPWNRIAPDHVGILAPLGYAAYSTFRSKSGRDAGLRRIDTHIDPVDWHGGRGLADPAMLLAGLARDIEARWRAVGPPEPIGILTHHLVSTEPVWSFCERLLDRLSASPAVAVRSIDDLLGTSSPRHATAVVFSDPDGLESIAEGGR